MLFKKGILLSQSMLAISMMSFGLMKSENAFAKPVKILADTYFLQSLGIKPTSTDATLQLSTAEISEYQADTIAHSAHKFRKCGGFERLPDSENMAESFATMRQFRAQAHAFDFIGNPVPNVEKNPTIEAATKMVSADNLRETVQWLSNYPSRFHKGTSKHVEDLAEKIKALLAQVNYPYQIESITHTQTKQKTLKVHLEGKDHPEEIIVLGAHLDSIVNWGGGGSAPGADDNASGSSNILEALRIIATQPQASRSIEFFWYAGEEGGLIGSSEIAQKYKQANTNVIGVMQLDMTLFPGEGELVIGDVSDFTNPWLRSYLKTLNDFYVGAQWKNDECGYACSDHASWHRQGYATVMPFEATSDTMNQDLHTSRDVISPRLSFTHSAAFAKLAVAYALDLSNSTLKPTF